MHRLPVLDGVVPVSGSMLVDILRTTHALIASSASESPTASAQSASLSMGLLVTLMHVFLFYIIKKTKNVIKHKNVRNMYIFMFLFYIIEKTKKTNDNFKLCLRSKKEARHDAAVLVLRCIATHPSQRKRC